MRLANYQLDTALEELLRHTATLRDKKKALEDLNLVFARESDLVQAQPDLIVTFPAYIEHYKHNREKALGAIAVAQHAVDEAGQRVRDLFLELKKYEEIQTTERAHAQKELDLREQAEMNEIGIQLHRRVRNGRSQKSGYPPPPSDRKQQRL